MPKYLRLEIAIAELGNINEYDSAVYARADMFEGILNDEKTTPSEKASKLAKLIENLNKNRGKRS